VELKRVGRAGYSGKTLSQLTTNPVARDYKDFLIKKFYQIKRVGELRSQDQNRYCGLAAKKLYEKFKRFYVNRTLGGHRHHRYLGLCRFGFSQLRSFKG
jgi:hypothetical protein